MAHSPLAKSSNPFWIWLIGITWLALPFGIYFAIKLSAANQGPASRARAVGLALLGTVLVAAGMFLYRPPVGFPWVLIYLWAVMAVGAAIQFAAWPRLARVMSAYGFAARIPVVVIMFLAMLGDWGRITIMLIRRSDFR